MNEYKQYFVRLLAIINIVVGFGIVLSIASHNILPGNITWIQITGLIFPIMAIIALSLLVFFVIIKSKFRVISLLIVIISLTSFPRNFQLTFFNQSTPDNSDLKLVTYNVQRFGIDNNIEKSPAIRDSIISFLIKENADIYCIQEYHSADNNLYEPLKNIRDNLNSITYYYESYFNPRYNQLSGLAIFSCYQAINKGKLKFTGSRTFGIYIDIIVNHDTIRLYNIHLASIKLEPADLDFVTTTNPGKDNHSSTLEIYHKLANAYTLREKQINEIKKEIIASPYPVLLCGDFNDSPNSWAYSEVNSILNDAFKSKGNGIGRTYNGPIPLLRIDYIFTESTYYIKGFHRPMISWSDHFPISAIISKH